MDSDTTVWNELQAKFLRDFGPAEQLVFLKKAKEAITRKGYPVGEDLFHYCYFHTMKERFVTMHAQGGEGYMRFLLVQAAQDIEQEITFYRDRLEKKKMPVIDTGGFRLMERMLKGKSVGSGRARPIPEGK